MVAVMDENKNLLRTIERFLDRHGMSESTFGRAAAGSPNFISNLRKAEKGEKKGPTTGTVNRIKRFISDYEGVKP